MNFHTKGIAVLFSILAVTWYTFSITVFVWALAFLGTAAGIFVYVKRPSSPYKMSEPPTHQVTSLMKMPSFISSGWNWLFHKTGLPVQTESAGMSSHSAQLPSPILASSPETVKRDFGPVHHTPMSLNRSKQLATPFPASIDSRTVAFSSLRTAPNFTRPASSFNSSLRMSDASTSASTANFNNSFCGNVERRKSTKCVITTPDKRFVSSFLLGQSTQHKENMPITEHLQASVNRNRILERRNSTESASSKIPSPAVTVSQRPSALQRNHFPDRNTLRPDLDKRNLEHVTTTRPLPVVSLRRPPLQHLRPDSNQFSTLNSSLRRQFQTNPLQYGALSQTRSLSPGNTINKPETEDQSGSMQDLLNFLKAQSRKRARATEDNEDSKKRVRRDSSSSCDSDGAPATAPPMSMPASFPIRTDVPPPQIQVPTSTPLVTDRKRSSEAITEASSPIKTATPKRRRIDVIEGSLSSSQRETQKRPAGSAAMTQRQKLARGGASETPATGKWQLEEFPEGTPQLSVEKEKTSSAETKMQKEEVQTHFGQSEKGTQGKGKSGTVLDVGTPKDVTAAKKIDDQEKEGSTSKKVTRLRKPGEEYQSPLRLLPLILPSLEDVEMDKGKEKNRLSRMLRAFQDDAESEAPVTVQSTIAPSSAPSAITSTITSKSLTTPIPSAPSASVTTISSVVEPIISTSEATTSAKTAVEPVKTTASQDQSCASLLTTTTTTTSGHSPIMSPLAPESAVTSTAASASAHTVAPFSFGVAPVSSAATGTVTSISGPIATTSVTAPTPAAGLFSFGAPKTTVKEVSSMPETTLMKSSPLVAAVSTPSTSAFTNVPSTNTFQLSGTSVPKSTAVPSMSLAPVSTMVSTTTMSLPFSFGAPLSSGSGGFSFGQDAYPAKSATASPTTAKFPSAPDSMNGSLSTAPSGGFTFGMAKSSEGSAASTISSGFTFPANTGPTTPSSKASQSQSPPTTSSTGFPTPSATPVFQFGATKTTAAPVSGVATAMVAPASKNVFAFGSSSTNLSGVPITTHSSFPTFGATTTSTPLFGAPATSVTPTFGVAPATTATAAPVFGATAIVNPLFGVTAAATPLFGATTTASTGPTFGTQTTSATPFGMQTTSATSVFGTQTTSAPSVFGTQTSGNPVFGSQTTSAVPSFASSMQTTTGASVFGTQSASATSSTFGSSAPSAGFTFNAGKSSAPAYGTSESQKPIFSFGMSKTPATTAANFTSPPTVTTASSAPFFAFGSSQPAPQSVFQFGGAPAAKTAVAMTTASQPQGSIFTFGQSAASTAPSSSFTFNSPANSSQAPSFGSSGSAGFQFGAQPSGQSFGTATGSQAPAAVTQGFSFAATSPQGGFNFSSQQQGSTAQPGVFQFGSTNQQAPSFASATSPGPGFQQGMASQTTGFQFNPNAQPNFNFAGGSQPPQFGAPGSNLFTLGTASNTDQRPKRHAMRRSRR